MYSRFSLTFICLSWWEKSEKNVFYLLLFSFQGLILFWFVSLLNRNAVWQVLQKPLRVRSSKLVHFLGFILSAAENDWNYDPRVCLSRRTMCSVLCLVHALCAVHPVLCCVVDGVVRPGRESNEAVCSNPRLVAPPARPGPPRGSSVSRTDAGCVSDQSRCRDKLLAVQFSSRLLSTRRGDFPSFLGKRRKRRSNGMKEPLYGGVNECQSIVLLGLWGEEDISLFLNSHHCFFIRETLLVVSN